MEQNLSPEELKIIKILSKVYINSETINYKIKKKTKIKEENYMFRIIAFMYS